MQSAGSSSQGQDASASTSASNSDPHHADPQIQPRKKPNNPEALFRRASRANSLPEFIEALNIARDLTRPGAQSSPYPTVIKTGLFSSIRRGRTSLAAYLLDKEPLAQSILRECITPGVIGENASISLFDLLIVQHGWDINTDGGLPNDRRPLISWVLYYQNEHELVCWLLDHNARVDFGEDNWAIEGLWPRPPALLETCALVGSVESFRLLQAKGAKLSRRTLHLCCKEAALFGADPGLSSQEQDNLGREKDFEGEIKEGTANFELQAQGLVQRPRLAAMLQFLVDEVGLDVNQTDTDLIGLDWHVGTPLCYAATKKRGVAVVRWLLGKGADPLFMRYNLDAEARAKSSGCHEAVWVLEQWRELNPEKVQKRKRKISGSGFQMYTEWRGRTWQEWEAYRKEIGRSTW